jgi:hypothetical protein
MRIAELRTRLATRSERYSTAGALTDRPESTPSPFSATDTEYIEGWQNPCPRHKGLGQK